MKLQNTRLALYRNDKLVSYFVCKEDLTKYIELQESLNEDTSDYKIKQTLFYL